MDKYITPLFLVAVIIITITATFLHNIFPEKSLELQEHLSTYKLLINTRDVAHADLLEKLHDKQINIEEFYHQYNVVTQEYKIAHKKYLKVKKELKAQQSILGYTSLKNFLLSFGIRLFALVTSLFFLYGKVHQSYSSQYKKRFHLIAASSFVLTASYWFTWSLIYKVNSIGEYDFEQWHQNVLLVISPILILASSYFLFKHYQTIEEKFKKTIRNIFRYIYESREDLKEDKKQEHTIKRGKLIKETIENVG